MIFNKLEDNKINNVPVVIFGSGPAGISLALELEKKNIESFIIEAGGENYNLNSQKFYNGKVIGDQITNLNESRLRQFGGTSGIWGGWSIPFENYDFDKWPIKYNDIKKFEERACEIFKIKKKFNKSSLDQFFNQIEFQYSKVKFSEDYKDHLKKSKKISIFLNTQLTHFVGKNKKTDFAACVSNDKKFKIYSKFFVLACGGLENSRILLWTKKKSPNLINNNLPIGEYWMTHPWILAGKGLINKKMLENDKSFNLIDYDGALHFATNHNFLKSKKLLSAAIYLNTTEDKNFIKNLVKDILCVAPKYGKKIANDIFNKNIKCGNIFMHLEDLAKNDNKILLDDKEKDQFGIPILNLKYSRSIAPLRTAKKFLTEFAYLCQKKNYGRIAINEDIFDEKKYESLGEYHHIGGTRIGLNMSDSVVNKDLMVHETNNLYVGGSSIFRTSSYCNPTFTIVQFVLRLASHLEKKIIK